jgi:hypothetical protein
MLALRLGNEKAAARNFGLIVRTRQFTVSESEPAWSVRESRAKSVLF